MHPAITATLMYIWGLVKTWGSLFAAPYKNLIMLWLIIPIYLNWLFADFFQEKKKTSLGNAITNATIIFWVCVDWSRTTVNFYADKTIGTWNLVWKLALASLIFLYGLWIVIDGIKGKELTHYIGRVRVVTYIALMFTPIMYNAIDINYIVFLTIVIFFPVFYYLIELIDKITPDPKSIVETSGSLDSSSSLGGSTESSDFGKDTNLDKDFKI